MIVTLTLGSGVKPELIFSSVESHRRLIRLSGEPSYSSTYPDWDLKLLVEGTPVERPRLLLVLVREAVGQEEDSAGGISYVEAFEHGELGINEPTLFQFDVVYSPATFERLWSILGSSYGELTVSVSVQAPKETFSHEAIFEISESSLMWAADLRASRT